MDEKTLNRLQETPLSNLSQADLILYCDFLLSENTVINSLNEYLVDRNNKLFDENTSITTKLNTAYNAFNQVSKLF